MDRHRNPVGHIQEKSAEPSATSAAIRARVAQARRHRAERVAIDGALASRGHSMLHAGLDRDARTMLRTASSSISVSARAYARVTRVARTMAALEGSSLMTATHVAEALHFGEDNPK